MMKKIRKQRILKNEDNEFTENLSKTVKSNNLISSVKIKSTPK